MEHLYARNLYREGGGGGSSLREGSILEYETKPAREVNPSSRESRGIVDRSSPEDRLPFESPLSGKRKGEGEQTLMLS